jgi:3-hydroxybutyryl-CoA dehydrogenase
VPDDIKKIVVVGGGLMGSGIAQTFAQSGYEVALVDIQRDILTRAKELIESSLNTFAQEGWLVNKQIHKTIKRIKFTTSLEEGTRDADIAIEAVTEDAEIKRKVFAQLDNLCPPRTVLASNTTSLNIFDILQTSRPEKVIVCHWYAPPQIIPLVDVVRGPQSSDESIRLIVQVLKNAKKKPVVMNKFISGYVIPRLQMAIQREVFYLIDNEYLAPEDLDEAVKYGLAMRMMILGVVQRIDFGGLDLTARNLQNPSVQSQMTPLSYKPNKIFELTAQGHFGVKTGKGFYDYHDKSEAQVYRERDVKLIRMLKVLEELEAT